VIEGGFGENWNDAAQGMVETDLGPALLINIASLVRGPVLRTEAA
jgi:purine-binding chemotaxis protein CheW